MLPPALLMPRAPVRRGREAELAGVEDAVGVEGRLEAPQNVEPRAERTGQEAGAVEPDAVMVADGGAVRQRGVGHGVPGLAVVALAPFGVALGAAPAEGEVEAGAVGVGVGLVGRRGQGSLDRLERADDLVEEAGQRGPGARHLGGVDDDPAAPQWGQRRDVVAVTEPALDQVGVERLRAAPRWRTRRRRSQRGRQDGGIGLVEDDEDVGVGLLEVAGRLRLVVEAQDGRRRAAAQDPAAGLEAGREGGEAEGAAAPAPAGGGGCGAGPR